MHFVFALILLAFASPSFADDSADARDRERAEAARLRLTENKQASDTPQSETPGKGFRYRRPVLDQGVFAFGLHVASFQGDHVYNQDGKRVHVTGRDNVAPGGDVNERRLEIGLRYGLLEDLTFGIVLPYVSREVNLATLVPDFSSRLLSRLETDDAERDGLGDVRLSLDYGLPTWWQLRSAIGSEAKLNTGETDASATEVNLGTGQTNIDGYLQIHWPIGDWLRLDLSPGYTWRLPGEAPYQEFFLLYLEGVQRADGSRYEPKDEYWFDSSLHVQFGNVVPGLRIFWFHEVETNRRNMATATPRLLYTGADGVDMFIEYETPFYGRSYPHSWPLNLGDRYLAVGNEVRAGFDFRFGESQE